MGNNICTPTPTPADTAVDTTEAEILAKQNSEVGSQNYCSFWTGASRSKLADLEKRLFEKTLKECSFTQSVRGGLGTISVSRLDEQDESQKPLLVMVHGYGMANVAWLLTLDRLSRSFRVLLVELHGHGRSDRPEFPENLTAGPAEIYMSSWLEKWREESKIEEPFFLAGHSLGAMVSWRYAALHPQRLRHLILVSPAGVSPAPENFEERMQTSSTFIRYILKKWQDGTTPMDVIRSFGPLGYRLMRAVVTRRMQYLPPSSAAHTLDTELFVDIMHQSWSLPASGERAMNAMLRPGAFAYLPLMERVEADLFKQSDPATFEGVDLNEGPDLPPAHLPTSLIYGAQGEDWMRPQYGYVLVNLMRQRVGCSFVQCDEVPSAGHVVPLDNPDGLVDAILRHVQAAGTNLAE